MGKVQLFSITVFEIFGFAKKINKDIVSLVITSYNYFEYAQEAIKLDVEDFILKKKYMALEKKVR